MKRRSLLGWLAAMGPFAAAASAAPLALPAPPSAKVTQRLGATLPSTLALRDETGAAVRLGDFFDGHRPVLLVLGYYRCAQLCGLVMHGLLQGLHDSGVARTDWRIVGVSIDPQDTPASARERRARDLAYADFLQGERKANAPLDLHLLTSAPDAIRVLTEAAGFGFKRVDDVGVESSFAHAASVMVATPTGRISRYLMGVGFEPAELKLALAEASGDRIGALTTRLALLCAHFDPQVGRLDGAIMNGMRLLGLGTAAGLATWCWRRRDGRSHTT